MSLYILILLSVFSTPKAIFATFLYRISSSCNFILEALPYKSIKIIKMRLNYGISKHFLIFYLIADMDVVGPLIDFLKIIQDLKSFLTY